AHLRLLLAAAGLLLLARVLLAPDSAQLFELRGVVAHGTLARLAGLGAVLAARHLAEILRRLVERHEPLGDEAERQMVERRSGPLELARVADRTRRLELARLHTKAAVHALSHVDVEAAHGLLLGRG